MKKRIFTLLLFCYIIIQLDSCREPFDPTAYPTYPIDLNVEKLADGSYRYTWTPIRASELVGYWVTTASADSVPYIDSASAFQLTKKGIFVVKSIVDKDSTTIIDSTTIRGKKAAVRVFAFLEGRVLSSKSISLEGNPNVNDDLVFDANHIDYEPNKGILGLFDVSRNGFLMYDVGLNREISKGNIVDNVFNDPFSRPQTSSLLPTMGFDGISANFYVFNSNLFTIQEVNIASGSRTSLNSFSNNTTSLVSLKTTPNAILISNSDNFNNGSQIVGFQKLSSFYSNSGSINLAPITDAFTLHKMPITKRVWAWATNDTRKNYVQLEYVTNGSFASGAKGFMSHIGASKDIKPFAFTSNEQLIIMGSDARIYRISNLTSSTTLSDLVPTSKPEYQDIISMNNKIYALRKHLNIKQNRQIDVFTVSNTTVTFEKNIKFDSQPTKIIFNNNMLYLVGKSPNTAQRFILERITP